MAINLAPPPRQEQDINAWQWKEWLFSLYQRVISLDTGTDIGDIVELENVGGSAGLPAVDGSQLTGVLAAPVSGEVVQVVIQPYAAVATGTTVIPRDNTIPQNTEGDEYMSRSITPKYADSTLIIETVAMLDSSVGNHKQSAIFRDSGADAIATGTTYQAASGAPDMVYVAASVSASSTASTTFKVRCGGSAAGTTTFNGVGGAGLFGTAVKSYIKITEIKA